MCSVLHKPRVWHVAQGWVLVGHEIPCTDMCMCVLLCWVNRILSPLRRNKNGSVCGSSSQLQAVPWGYCSSLLALITVSFAATTLVKWDHTFYSCGFIHLGYSGSLTCRTSHLPTSLSYTTSPSKAQLQGIILQSLPSSELPPSQINTFLLSLTTRLPHSH